MALQPIKKRVDYEKKFSNELQEVLMYAVDELSNAFPFTSIDFDTFLLAALESEDCMLYKSVNGFLNTANIEEIHDSLYLKLKDYNVSPVRPGRTIDYSGELRNYFIKANDIIEQKKFTKITSDIVFLSFMRNTPDENETKKLFLMKGYTEEIAESKTDTLQATLSKILEMSDEDIKTMEGDPEIEEIVTREDLMKSAKESEKKTFKEIDYCKNLNELASSGEIQAVVGRDEEIRQITNILSRKKCNNVILVGDPGVGKTAIVEGLAKMIEDGVAPLSLKNAQIWKLNVDELVAGTNFRGQFESRAQEVAEQISQTKSAILFIDDIHRSSEDGKRGEYDIFGAFWDLFSDGKTMVILCTNHKGYRSVFDANPDVSRRFQKLTIEPPSAEMCEKILNSLVKSYEKFHGIRYDYTAIDACINLAKRYVSEKSLPASAIDLMDEAGAAKKNQIIEPENVKEAKNEIAELASARDTEIYSDNLEDAKIISEYINDAKVNLSKQIEKAKRNRKNYCVTDYDICQLIAERTGIPVNKIKSSESESVSKIDKFLKEKIVGQDEAIDTVARAIKRSRVGLSNPDRPIFSCMCIGNTGCGKTLLAKTLALEMFGDEKSLIRFDMSEYSDSTSVNKLIGSSAGYVGYKEGGLLTEAVKKRKYSVLLIDEIEKAHDEVFNLFLQILDEGNLTDNTGYKVDFRNTIIILTSNVGAKRAANEKAVGFDADSTDNKRSIIEKELKNKFPPEFINRIDEIVYFNQLTDENLRNIVILEIEKLKKRLQELKYGLTYGDDVVDFILNIALKDKEYGARPISRAVRNEIENRITDEILSPGSTKKEFAVHVADGAIFIE